MNKRLPAALTLTAALALGSVFAQSAPTDFKDIPAGHWAKEAVTAITQAGLIQGFPDGTFRGNENLTRYQAALIMQRLLDHMAKNPGMASQLDPKMVATLQKAVEELRADLAKLGVRVTNLEANKADLARVQQMINQAMATSNGGQDPAALRDLMNQIKAANDNANAANAKASEMQAQFNELSNQVEAAALAADTALSQARELQDKLDEMAGQMDGGLVNRVSSLEKAVADFKALSDAMQNMKGGTSAADLQALRDLVAANQAALTKMVADLNDRVAKGEGQSSQLNTRIDSLNNRVNDFGNRTNTRLDGLDAKVSDLTAAFEDRFGQVGSSVETQASSITALNDLVVILNDDVEALQSKVGDLESNVTEQGETIGLVRRDLSALTDRTTGVENRVTEVEKRTTSLETRVSTLEFNTFTISGTLRVLYYQAHTWLDKTSGSNNTFIFDTDRYMRNDFLGNTVANPFTSGVATTTLKDGDSSIYFADQPGEAKATRKTGRNDVDVDGFIRKYKLDTRGKATVDFRMFLALKRNLTGGDSQGIVTNTFPTTLNIRLQGDPTVDGLGDPYIYGGKEGTELGLRVYNISSTFTVGNTPLLIDFGQVVPVKLSPLAYNNDCSPDCYYNTNDSERISGFRADADLPLPLNPKLTVFYGAEIVPGTDNPNADGRFIYNAGGKFGISPFANINLAGYYAYSQFDVGYATANSLKRVYGGFVEANKAFGFVNLLAEYSHSETQGVATIPGNDAYYVKGGVDFDVFSIGANYRRMGEKYDGLSNDTDKPFALNQVGFGANAVVRLGFLEISGLYNQANDLDPAIVSDAITITESTTAIVDHTDFKVGAALKFAGFTLKPEFTSINETERSGGAGFSLEHSKLFVGLNHDGAATDALIKGLNLNASYQMDMLGGKIYTGAFQRSTIKAGADYKLALGTLSVRPKVSFEMVSFDKDGVNYAPSVVGKPSVQPSGTNGGTDPSNATNARGGDDLMNFGYGVSISTGPILFDSLGFEFAYSKDSTEHTKRSSGNFTASTEQYSAGIVFSKFLFPGSTFKAYWFGRNDFNRRLQTDVVSSAPFVDIAGVGYIMNGLMFQFGYAGISFDYGIFNFDNVADASKDIAWGNFFKISYTLKF